jgi:hypothetical protein
MTAISANPNGSCFSKLAKEAEVTRTTRGHIFNGMSKLTGVALFIIACIGAAGILPGSTMGWIAIGLGGGSFALKLAAGQLKDKKITLLLTALLTLFPIVIGGLGVAGIFSGVQIGWILIVPTIATIPIGCCVGCCVGYIATQAARAKLEAVQAEQGYHSFWIRS